jgi:hypothetical protein
MSRIFLEYTGHNKLWEETDESITYVPGIYRAFYVVERNRLNLSRI